MLLLLLLMLLLLRLMLVLLVVVGVGVLLLALLVLLVVVLVLLLSSDRVEACRRTHWPPCSARTVQRYAFPLPHRGKDTAFKSCSHPLPFVAKTPPLNCVFPPRPLSCSFPPSCKGRPEGAGWAQPAVGPEEPVIMSPYFGHAKHGPSSDMMAVIASDL